MRWRAAAPIALCALAVSAPVSVAAAPSHSPTLRVTVKPPSGSGATHFAISFRAAVATGRFASVHRAYRITASDRGRAGCQSSAAAVAAPAQAGTTVRVVLSPAASEAWCPGTFRGQVWDVLSPACPLREACPALLPLPRLAGRFTFRVTRG
jgi:hypothetical protein